MRVHTAEEYADQYDQLMPVGLAWDRYRGYALAKLLEAFAVEHTRLEGHAINLVLKEFFPQTTRELLVEWETEWGLPDECTPAGATIAERIEILLRKIRSRGGQSIRYFTDLLKTMGIDIVITEFKPFRVGYGRMGDRLNDRTWCHVFHVMGPAVRIYHFRMGLNRMGDRLRTWRRNEILECIINKLKPAHTFAMFGYLDDGASFFAVAPNGDVRVRDNPPTGISPTVKSEDGIVFIRDDPAADINDAYNQIEENGDISLKDDVAGEL